MRHREQAIEPGLPQATLENDRHDGTVRLPRFLGNRRNLLVENIVGGEEVRTDEQHKDFAVANGVDNQLVEMIAALEPPPIVPKLKWHEPFDSLEMRHQSVEVLGIPMGVRNEPLHA